MDPIFNALLLLNLGLWGFVGFQICCMTHRQRGIDTDPWEQVKIPDDPSGICLPEDFDRVLSDNYRSA
jgi:hypothetical protein